MEATYSYCFVYFVDLFSTCNTEYLGPSVVFYYFDITLIFIKNVKVRIKINHTGGLNIYPFIRNTVKLVYMEIIPELFYIMINLKLENEEWKKYETSYLKDFLFSEFLISMFSCSFTACFGKNVLMKIY